MKNEEILAYEKMFERDLEIEKDTETKLLIQNILYDLVRIRNRAALLGQK